jgi:hypothetical protein
MCFKILLSLVLCLVAGSAAAQAPEPFERTIILFSGLCEASAAMPLGSGKLAVADDEKEDLRGYSKDQPGSPKKIEISGLPGLSDTDDLEGGARIGDTLYWITSHSRTRRGRSTPERRRLFAVRINPEDFSVRPVGKPYTILLDDLQRDDRFARLKLGCAAELPAEEPGALNIEGLAASPDGKLLIGFRNPIREGKALIVPLNNPGDVVEGRPAIFGDPVELDLGGLGIRSMEFWQARSAYVILAGPSGAAGPFRIFSWSGTAGDKPLLMKEDLTGLIPEALFIDGDELFILSDDGDVCPEPNAFRAGRFRPSGD